MALPATPRPAGPAGVACGARSVLWGGVGAQARGPPSSRLARCSTALAGGPCPPHLAMSTLLAPAFPALPAPTLPASCPVLTLLLDPFSTSKSRRAARLAPSPGLRPRQPLCPASPALETTRLAGQQGPELFQPDQSLAQLQAKARVGLPRSTMVRPAQGPGQLRQGRQRGHLPQSAPLPASCVRTAPGGTSSREGRAPSAPWRDCPVGCAPESPAARK